MGKKWPFLLNGARRRAEAVITHGRISGAIKRNGRLEAETIPRIYKGLAIASHKG